eukprot:TRINITY_DN15855_c0_g1_i2.p1 TRINITY_DN15855_c0_g1~~TRINITY_DN15855_c0_g1_i2.p1  ORF type:complete len:675 (-),score=151.06 TRINITY_DN15855_c0_g1_i2:62-2086(-)
MCIRDRSRSSLRPHLSLVGPAEVSWRALHPLQCPNDPTLIRMEQLKSQSIHRISQCTGLTTGLTRHMLTCTAQLTDWNHMLKTHRHSHDSVELECELGGSHRIDIDAPVQEVWLLTGAELRKLSMDPTGRFTFKMLPRRPLALTEAQVHHISDVLAAAGHPGQPFSSNEHLAAIVNHTAQLLLPVLPAAHLLEDCSDGLSKEECALVEEHLIPCVNAIATMQHPAAQGQHPGPLSYSAQHDAVLRVTHLLIGSLQNSRCLQGLQIDTDGGQPSMLKQAAWSVLLAVGGLGWVWQAWQRRNATKIMISYKHQDQERAIQIQKQFESLGFQVWIDLDIRAGKDWRADIAKAISSAHAVIFLMSPKSVTSPYCREEIYYAVSEDKPVYTIVLDQAWEQLSGGLKLVLMRFQCVHAEDGIEEACSRVAAEVRELCSSRSNTPQCRVASIDNHVTQAQDSCPRSGVYLCHAEHDNVLACQLALMLRQRDIQVVISQRSKSSLTSDAFDQNASSIDKCSVFVAFVTPLSAQVSSDRGGFLDDVHYAHESKHQTQAPDIVAFDTRSSNGLEGSLGMMLVEDEFVRTSTQTVESANLELVIRVLSLFRSQLQPDACTSACASHSADEAHEPILPTQAESPVEGSETIVSQIEAMCASVSSPGTSPTDTTPLVRTPSGRAVFY